MFWRGNDQRHAGIEFKIGGLSPQRMLANVETMIRCKNDNRASGMAPVVQCIQDLTDLGV